MARTFAIGDIHGDIEALLLLLSRLPELRATDTLVFVGDYLDRGPCSAEVVTLLRKLPEETPAKVVTLRGNHEDAWLRIVDDGWPEFIIPRSNGCLETLRSFQGRPPPGEEMPNRSDIDTMLKGNFFPADVIEWMRAMPFFYEDEQAIYVHAGIPQKEDGSFPHPSVVEPQLALLWCRDKDFFRSYDGKLVVFGHTATEQLPPELSSYTPEDPTDLWAGPCTVGLDTGCGKGGFLTAVELPGMHVFESR
jgi:serine/threonine protein phosphatase 1